MLVMTKCFEACYNGGADKWCVRKYEDSKCSYWTGTEFIEDSKSKSIWETDFPTAVAKAEQLMTESFPEGDSAPATLKHQKRVKELCQQLCDKFLEQASTHDQSKMEDPEKPIFDKYTPELHGLTYGTKEYEESLKNIGPALEHHYATNRHHPEFHENGVDDMNLIDIIEMFCDWKAATERHDDGSLTRSITINAEKKKLNPQLAKIFENTAKTLGWL